MKEGKATEMLEKMRLREVALNSIFAKTGQKVRVKAVKVHKNNNERAGFEVRDEEIPVAITYYPRPEELEQPDVCLIEQIAAILREERDNVGLIASEPTREAFIANLMPEVLGAKNAEWLEESGRPCRMVLDMVVTLRCQWGNEASNTLASCLVTKHLLERYNLSEDEAFEYAMRNNEDSSEIVPIRKVVEDLVGHEMPEEECEQAMYVVSNAYCSKGASLMFSKKIQSELLEIFGRQSVAVLPSSVDEFIAVNAELYDMDGLKEMVAEVNRTQVDPEARLTDEVYVITGTPEKPILGMHTSLGLPGQTFLVARY